MKYLALLTLLAMPTMVLCECVPMNRTNIYEPGIPITTDANGFQWQRDGNRSYCYKDGQFLGLYNYTNQVWTDGKTGVQTVKSDWPKLAKKECNCGKGCNCGSDCKCASTYQKCCEDCKCVVIQQPKTTFAGATLDRDGTLNFGVASKQISKEDNYLLNGVTSLSKSEAQDLVRGKGLDDDSSKYFVVLVGGSEGDRSKFIQTIKSDPTLKDKISIQTYSQANHYHLDPYKLAQDQRFQQSGFMVALIHPADKAGFGKREVVQYTPNVDTFLSEAKRKIDPNFDPNKKDAPVGDINYVGWGIVIGACLLGFGIIKGS